MAIKEHPPIGTILRCDYNHGFVAPEMVKPRLIVVVSHRIRARPGLCTVVPLSTTAPDPVMPYHVQLDISPALPEHYSSTGVWVKGDMINAVGFHRLNLVSFGKSQGRRAYYLNPLNDQQIKLIRNCILHGLGLSSLTNS